MNTREQILAIGDELIRDRGVNAFSFSDISARLGIKNASVHYHFPTKAALCLGVIHQQEEALQRIIAQTHGLPPLEQLDAYLSIYSRAQERNLVCLMGSLAPGLHTLDEPVAAEVRRIADSILDWVTTLLQNGRNAGAFTFAGDARSRALIVISIMIASLQLTRLTTKEDFNIIKEQIIKDLTS